MMTQSYGWILQRLQHSRNDIIIRQQQWRAIGLLLSIPQTATAPHHSIPQQMQAVYN